MWCIAFLLAFFATPSEAAKKTRKIYVMAVGVGKYQSTQIKSLTNPAHDADSIANFFGAGNAEVLVLKDTEATGDSIRSKMRSFFSKSTKYDNVLFFFSGHGTHSGFCSHDYLAGFGGCVTYDDIKKIFQSVDAYGKMIMADACFSGVLRSKPKQEEQVAVPNNPPAVVVPDNTKSKQQVMLFLSSRNDEYSYEDTYYTNGYFTYHLCKALKGDADVNHNGVITAEELSNYVSAKVKEMSFDRQHPVMWGNFNKGWIISRVNSD